MDKQKEIKRKMLVELKKFYRIQELVNELYELTSGYTTAPDFESIIMDLSGIPKDSSAEVPMQSNKFFCRDYWSNIIFHYLENTIGLEACLKKLTKYNEK